MAKQVKIPTKVTQDVFMEVLIIAFSTYRKQPFGPATQVKNHTDITIETYMESSSIHLQKFHLCRLLSWILQAISSLQGIVCRQFSSLQGFVVDSVVNSVGREGLLNRDFSNTPFRFNFGPDQNDSSILNKCDVHVNIH